MSSINLERGPGVLHPAAYRDLMQNHAGAVAVIAVGSVGSRTGLTATAVCSVSDAPPTLLACVNQKASAHPLIQKTAVFSVNFLGESDEDLALRFAGQSNAAGEDRFQHGKWSVGPNGAPLLSSALLAFECILADAHTYATHSVFIGTVAYGVSNNDQEPLVYFRRRFGLERLQAHSEAISSRAHANA